MTVLPNMDAVPTDGAKWNSIDWNHAHRMVMRLQVRIAKATREGCWRKVKALQWLLTHSYAAKLLAVKKITTNRGKRTPGVDGVLLKTPEDKAAMANSLMRCGYTPSPLKRIYIPKSNGKKDRPLGIPTMLDRGMQALHTLALLPMSETLADWNSYGFRPERCTADAIEALFKRLCRKDAPQWILEGDIKGCFDNISHEWMLKNICTDTTVLRKWLNAGYMEKAELFPTHKGTPQGGIASPTLANLVLDGIENLLGKKFNSLNRYGLRRQASPFGIHFVRYADDFVITGNSKEILEEEVYPAIEEFLKERGLELSKEKTKITHISEGFDFLGQNIRKYGYGKDNAKLLIKPCSKNIKTFLTGIRKTIKSMATATQENLIRKLNPMIQGWANYHRSIVSKTTYNKVDNEIWKAIWRWAMRRHPNKGKAWVHSRYFRKIKERNHCFSCIIKDGNGKAKIGITLKHASDTFIKRHIKIQSEATPFDPNYEAYFENRMSTKMANNKEGRRKVAALWRRQGGCCSMCGERITSITNWRVHHMESRLEGGSENLSNLILLHPICQELGFTNGFVYVFPAEANNAST
ncbi:MAG: group II intron reverse transcriptase/maturase [Chitinophagaceae bacterium]